jgi:amidase
VTPDQDTVGAFFHDDLVHVPPTASGGLDGLSCGVKDAFDIAGYKTGFGNPTWRDTHPAATRHARVVQAVLANGATVVGKTHTDELAFSLSGINHHYGAPINRAAEGRVVGGSSSGSAAAVAAGLCDFALGTDTGGSVRAPASFCGLFGFRPTHGALSVEGVCNLAPSFDAVGWFAREFTVFDRVGQCLLPADTDALSSGPMAFWDDAWALLSCEGAEGIARQGFADAMAAGPVVRVSIGTDAFDGWFGAFRTLQFHEVALELGTWLDAHDPPLGPGVSGRLSAARQVSRAEVAVAEKTRHELTRLVQGLLNDYQVIVVPTVPGAAPLRDEALDAVEAYRRTAMRLLCVAGLSGCPQVSLPLLRAEGAPLGLSLISRRGTDRALMKAARRFLGDRTPR